MGFWFKIANKEYPILYSALTAKNLYFYTETPIVPVQRN